MDYSYTTYSSSSTADPVAILAIATILFFIWMPLMVLMIISMWKVFTKAGKPGWASIVPIYNYIVMLEIVGRPLWWIAMFLIPVVGLVFQIMLYIELARAYGKDYGFAVLLIVVPIVGFPMLAFSKSAKYVGPVATDGVTYGYGSQPSQGEYKPQQQSEQAPEKPEQPTSPVQQ